MLQFFALSALVIVANGFSNGPPWKMCSLMIPKHEGLQQQRSEAPFSVHLPVSTYDPDGEVSVILRSKPAGPPFKGFVLGAHQLNGDTENVVGKFVKLPSNSRGLSWYAEAENVPNCVSHNNNEPKTTITFVWKAPSSHIGDIIFVAAVVKEFTVFWANVSSPPLRSRNRAQLTPFPAAITPGWKKISMQDTCGSTKGCILYPRHCKPDQCEIAVAFQKVGTDMVEFEMFGRSAGYVTLALSKDRRMGKDNTITCTVTKDKSYISVQNGYNPAYNNERHRITSFTTLQVARLGDKIYCRFRRPIDASVTTVAVGRNNVGNYSSVPFSLHETWIAFLATGDLYDGTNVINKHHTDPIISLGAVDFLSTKIFYASGLPLIVQLHGTFMLMAWMVFAGFGMIIAGNFKEVFTEMVCGAALWFQLHRLVMLCTVACTFIGIILIFVALGGWEERGLTHGAVGLTVLALIVIQVIMGFARPDPQHRRRFIFNWAHFLLGKGIHILAAVTILLAFFMPHLPPTLRAYNVIVVACWIGFQVAWVLLFHCIRICFKHCEKSNDKKEFSNPMNLQMEPSKTPNAKKMNVILILALILYAITVAIFFSVCVTFVVIF